jgi:hypothetical protein
LELGLEVPNLFAESILIVGLVSEAFLKVLVLHLEGLVVLLGSRDFFFQDDDFVSHILVDLVDVRHYDQEIVHGSVA